MSNLYATISSDARKTKPTARAHYEVSVTAQSWSGSVGFYARRDHSNPDAPATFALCVDGRWSTPCPETATRGYTAAEWDAAAPAIESALRAAREAMSGAGRLCPSCHKNPAPFAEGAFCDACTPPPAEAWGTCTLDDPQDIDREQMPEECRGACAGEECCLTLCPYCETD